MVPGQVCPFVYCRRYRRILVHHPVGKMPCSRRAAAESEHVKLHLRNRHFVTIKFDKAGQFCADLLQCFIGLCHHPFKLSDKAAAQRFTQYRITFSVCRPDAADIGFDLRLSLAVVKFIALLIKIEQPGNISVAALPACITQPSSGALFILLTCPSPLLVNQIGTVGICQP